MKMHVLNVIGSDSYLFDDGFESGHGNDSDPYRHKWAEKITELQHVILHDAEDHNAWLVTGMIKLFRSEGLKQGQKKLKYNDVNGFDTHSLQFSGVISEQ